MSDALIAWAVAGGYAAAWLVTARLLFGWWRTRDTLAKQGQWCPRHGWPKEDGYLRAQADCCLNAEMQAADGKLAAAAMLTAILWPLVALTVVVRAKPPMTTGERDALEKERAAELKQIRERNAELERELGLKGDPDA